MGKYFFCDRFSTIQLRFAFDTIFSGPNSCEYTYICDILVYRKKALSFAVLVVISYE